LPKYILLEEGGGRGEEEEEEEEEEETTAVKYNVRNCYACGHKSRVVR